MSKTFIVESDFGTFKVDIDGDSGWAVANIQEPGSEPGTAGAISVQKKWDGCSEIVIKNFHSHDLAIDADEIGFYIKTASYLCDQLMAQISFEYEDEETLEKALARMNCYDGADENPGITYKEEIK